jgi:hypothetical protein
MAMLGRVAMLGYLFVVEKALLAPIPSPKEVNLQSGLMTLY